MSRVFLTARWENLILISYRVKPDTLAAFMPPGLVPDTIEGSAFVSLVPFEFNDIRVKGFRIPFHVNFPEINLRFYVKNSQDMSHPAIRGRGVVFIREFVPNFLTPIVANAMYNENYQRVKMSGSLSGSGTEIHVRHRILIDGKEFNLQLKAENKPYKPGADSTEHFFKEHKWGFGKTRRGGLLTYRVEHPVWEIYPVIDYSHDFDFGFIYGKNWEFLNTEKPYNVMFAAGSEVKVFSPEH